MTQATANGKVNVNCTMAVHIGALLGGALTSITLSVAVGFGSQVFQSVQKPKNVFRVRG